MQTWRFGFTPHTLGGTCRTLDGADGRVELEGGVLSPVSNGISHIILLLMAELHMHHRRL